MLCRHKTVNNDLDAFLGSLKPDHRKPISPDSFTRIGDYKYTFGPDHLPLSAFNMTLSDITTPNPDFSSARLASSLGLAPRDDPDSPFEYNLICRGEGHWASHHATFQCREWLASRTYDHWRIKSSEAVNLCTVKDDKDEVIAHIFADTRSEEYVDVQASAAALAVQGLIDKCGWCTEKVCRTGGTNDLWGYLPWAIHVFAPKTYRDGDE